MRGCSVLLTRDTLLSCADCGVNEKMRFSPDRGCLHRLAERVGYIGFCRWPVQGSLVQILMNDPGAGESEIRHEVSTHTG